MSTVEYAIGTVAAAMFAVALLLIVKGPAVTAALTSVIQRALTVKT